MKLASEIARMAATAVENAQLFEHTKYTSQTLQKSLLPPELPDLGYADLAVRYRPFGDHDDLLGGDFYDIIRIRDDTWCVILGDVSGKGVAAATLASATRWSFRSIIMRASGPAVALNELNATLASQDWQERFVTAVAAVIQHDPSGSLSVRYSVGGHPSPIVRRSSGKAEVLPLRGTLIGAVSIGTWESDDLTLFPGDVLLLYSDGLSEVVDDAGAFFGEQGVMAAAAEAGAGGVADANTVVENVCLRATAFGRQRDDIAAIAICCPG